MCGTVPVVTCHACSGHTWQCTCHACSGQCPLDIHTWQCLHGAHTECISLIKQAEAGMRAKAREINVNINCTSCTFEVVHLKSHIGSCTSCTLEVAHLKLHTLHNGSCTFEVAQVAHWKLHIGSCTFEFAQVAERDNKRSVKLSPSWS